MRRVYGRLLVVLAAAIAHCFLRATALTQSLMGQSHHTKEPTSHPDEQPTMTHPITCGTQPFISGAGGDACPAVDSDGDAICDRFPEVFKSLVDTASRIVRSDHWRLLFTTRAGRSFPRMTRHICNSGPTAVVLELQSFGGETSAPQRMIVMSVNKHSWTTLAERNGAADVRAAGGGGSPPKKISFGFFGDSRCVVLLLDPLSMSSTLLVPKYPSSVGSSTIASANNFMYLVDDVAAPPSDVGIGMGGLPGRWLWYVGEDLEKCRIDHSGTFRCLDASGTEGTLLSPSEWAITHFDVFALEPEAHRSLEERRNVERRHVVKCFARDAAGVSNDDAPQRSVLESQSARTAMAVLQLGGAHSSYAHEREDICDR